MKLRNLKNGTIGRALFMSALLAAFVAFSSAFPSAAMAGESASAPEKQSRTSADGRYTDNGDDTVTDGKTGLMWTRRDAYQMTGHWMNWPDSYAFIKKLNDENFAGYNDWVMPSPRELLSLYEANKINGSQQGSDMIIHIDPIFEKDGAGALWSSETNGEFNANGIILNNGQPFNSAKSVRAKRSLRAVRHIAGIKSQPTNNTDKKQ